MDLVNVLAKLEICIFTRSCDNLQQWAYAAGGRSAACTHQMMIAKLSLYHPQTSIP